MVPGPTAIRLAHVCYHGDCVRAPGSLSPAWSLASDPAWAAALPGTRAWLRLRVLEWGQGHWRTSEQFMPAAGTGTLLWKGDGAGWILCPGVSGDGGRLLPGVIARGQILFMCAGARWGSGDG